MKICQNCLAIHDGKKWMKNMEKKEKIGDRELKKVLCEACKRKRDKIVYGIVYLEGPVLKERRDEIMQMIKKEEEIESSHNHLSQVLSIDADEDKMTITTINQWLALHLGKQFQKTFKGRLDIERDTSGRRGRGTKGREEVVVRWQQAA